MANTQSGRLGSNRDGVVICGAFWMELGALVSSYRVRVRVILTNIYSAWILVAEVWPLSARPYGIALGASSNWMNNFIVGQVTPDMITHMKYGIFIFFGVMIFIGSAFIWFYGESNARLSSSLDTKANDFLVPETKRLTLEEMDIVFGSSGVALADQERMAQINREIGLDSHLHGDQHSDDDKQAPVLDEKVGAHMSDRTGHLR
jgi:hypothetical protein